MNKKITLQSLSLPLIAVLFTSLGCATTKAESPTDTQTQNHEEHHSEPGNATNDSSGAAAMGHGMMDGGMMEKMDKTQMMNMMQECRSMQKDHKMCDHQAMTKCQQNMDKKPCMTMLKQAKKDGKGIKKTK